MKKKIKMINNIKKKLKLKKVKQKIKAVLRCFSSVMTFR